MVLKRRYLLFLHDHEDHLWILSPAKGRLIMKTEGSLHYGNFALEFALQGSLLAQSLFTFK